MNRSKARSPCFGEQKAYWTEGPGEGPPRKCQSWQTCGTPNRHRHSPYEESKSRDILGHIVALTSWAFASSVWPLPTPTANKFCSQQSNDLTVRHHSRHSCRGNCELSSE